MSTANKPASQQASQPASSSSVRAAINSLSQPNQLEAHQS